MCVRFFFTGPALLLRKCIISLRNEPRSAIPHRDRDGCTLQSLNVLAFATNSAALRQDDQPHVRQDCRRTLFAHTQANFVSQDAHSTRRPTCNFRLGALHCPSGETCARCHRMSSSSCVPDGCIFQSRDLGLHAKMQIRSVDQPGLFFLVPPIDRPTSELLPGRNAFRDIRD